MVYTCPKMKAVKNPPLFIENVDIGSDVIVACLSVLKKNCYGV
jgi:hypothetical protein